VRTAVHCAAMGHRPSVELTADAMLECQSMALEIELAAPFVEIDVGVPEDIARAGPPNCAG